MSTSREAVVMLGKPVADQIEARLKPAVAEFVSKQKVVPKLGIVLVFVVLVVRGRPLPTRGAIVQQGLGRAPRPQRLLYPTVVGSAVVEQVFGIPGMGRYFVQVALNRDYTLVLGVVLVIGALIVAINVAVDALRAWMDPRLGD